MALSKQLQKSLALSGRIRIRASKFPGNGKAPYVNPRKELKRICDWLVKTQDKNGAWPERGNYRFYSDAYAVRALLAASHLFNEKRYLRSAAKWCGFMVDIQRSDGGWWVGYGWGDHDFDDDQKDQTVVYLADAGEVTMAMICACHFLQADEGTRLEGGRVLDALLAFREMTDQYRLASGCMGNGYTCRDRKDGAPLRRPFQIAWNRPYPFATVVTGVNFYAGLYTLTSEADDWSKARQSLDWLLEHSHLEPGSGFSHGEEKEIDFMHLHRCMDVIFDAHDGSTKKAGRTHPTPEPFYEDRDRQKLYSIWKYCMHLLADNQSDSGEWPFKLRDKEKVLYDGYLRHRLYMLYSLTTYLQNQGARKGEDEALVEARNRQIWLCKNPEILHDHYGVGMRNEHVMPTGLWGMTLGEVLYPGITLPRRIGQILRG